MAAKTKGPNYYPSRNFDDSLDAFVRLVDSSKWSFPGVDLATLQKDVADQREERAQLAGAKAALALQETTFARNQHARYNRFSAVLNAARGVFRNDAAIIAQLDQFKRRASTKSTPQEETTTQTPAT